jgi:hypothetical protein
VVKSGSDFDEFSDLELIFNIENQEKVDQIKNKRESEDKTRFDDVKYLYSPQKRFLLIYGRVIID